MQMLRVIFEQIQREPGEAQRRLDEAFTILFEETLRTFRDESEDEYRLVKEVGEEGWAGKNQ